MIQLCPRRKGVEGWKLEVGSMRSHVMISFALIIGAASRSMTDHGPAYLVLHTNEGSSASNRGGRCRLMLARMNCKCLTKSSLDQSWRSYKTPDKSYSVCIRLSYTCHTTKHQIQDYRRGLVKVSSPFLEVHPQQSFPRLLRWRVNSAPLASAPGL